MHARSILGMIAGRIYGKDTTEICWTELIRSLGNFAGGSKVKSGIEWGRGRCVRSRQV